MLELLILKTNHDGDDPSEAKKLLPYVQMSQVFSPEAACRSDSFRTKCEFQWSDMLTQKISKSRFKREFSWLWSSGDESTRKYAEAAYELAFRNNRAIFYPERWSSDEEGRRIYSRMQSAFAQKEIGSLLLDSGVSDEAIRRQYLADKEIVECSVLRDQNMGTTLNGAEPRIRAKYPFLRNQEHLLLVIQIGSTHQIEDYVALPFKVESLVSGLDPFVTEQSRILQQIRQGAEYDALAPQYMNLFTNPVFGYAQKA